MTKLSKPSLVHLEVLSSNSHALLGVKNTLQILFRLSLDEIPRESKTERQPLNLSIVLDRSGSMQSESKLENSKKAIIEILKQLSKKDIVHFVTYESGVQVVLENGCIDSEQSLQELMKTVEGVETGGMTNLGGGLEEGARLVEKYEVSGEPRNRRVFLFSDGLVNVGVTSHQRLFQAAQKNFQKGISLTTFGIGSDYDEKLMRGLAERGGGVYYLIEKGDQIDQYVGYAFRDLVGLVGTHAKLQVRGLNSGLVTKIWGREEECLISGVFIGDLKEKTVKQLLVQVELTPTNSSGSLDGVLEEILTYSFEFVPMFDAESTTTTTTTTTEGEGEGETTTTTEGEETKEKEKEKIAQTKEKEIVKGTVKVNLTQDSEVVNSQKNQDVEVVLVIQQAGEEDQKILEDLEKGRVKEALEKEQRNIENLQKHQHFDSTGQVAKMIEQGQSAFVHIQKEGASQKAQKKVGHTRYVKQYFDSGYTCGYN